MKKVVLLGDSIRLIGYGKKTEEVLRAEGVEVWQPEDNCRYAKYTLRMLFDVMKHIKDADVIHWNNGHWDTIDYFGDGPFTSLEEYVANMTRIADILLETGAKLIFATSTPQHPDYSFNENARIKAYNDAVVPELEKRGVLINDLNELMEGHEIDGILEDQVHLNELGIELCAEQVVRKIREVL